MTILLRARINKKIVFIQVILSTYSIYIFYQIIEAKEQNLPSDYMTIFESVGYFKEDSIFLDLYYMNMYDPFIGHLWGKKN